MSVWRYAFWGDKRRVDSEFNSEVHCFRAILSVHDLLSDSGASERAEVRS